MKKIVLLLMLGLTACSEEKTNKTSSWSKLLEPKIKAVAEERAKDAIKTFFNTKSNCYPMPSDYVMVSKSGTYTQKEGTIFTCKTDNGRNFEVFSSAYNGMVIVEK